MKKWTGGVLIIVLACILLVRYSLIQKQPQKQSSYEFFRPNDKIASKSVEIEQEKLPKSFRKPHLVNVDGLDYLLNSTHMLKGDDAMPFLAWKKMRVLLSRSDSLPETSQGIKEAVVAWKQLKSKIDENRASKYEHDKDERNCSYSVSAVNTSTLFSGNGSVILEIPCGLIEASSVTIIAIPDGNQDGFQIEFLGLQGKEEPDPPVILHYNVVLPGHNFTKEPVIIQNSWTYDFGWGKEERCPNHRSPSPNNAKGKYYGKMWLNGYENCSYSFSNLFFVKIKGCKYLLSRPIYRVSPYSRYDS